MATAIIAVWSIKWYALQMYFYAPVSTLCLVIIIIRYTTITVIHRVKEKCFAHVQEIQNGIQLQGCVCSAHLPIYESHYSVMDEDFIPLLHILNQKERQL